jgi:hypothetical protein
LQLIIRQRCTVMFQAGLTLGRIATFDRHVLCGRTPCHRLAPRSRENTWGVARVGRHSRGTLTSQGPSCFTRSAGLPHSQSSYFTHSTMSTPTRPDALLPSGCYCCADMPAADDQTASVAARPPSRPPRSPRLVYPLPLSSETG